MYIMLIYNAKLRLLNYDTFVFHKTIVWYVWHVSERYCMSDHVIAPIVLNVGVTNASGLTV